MNNHVYIVTRVDVDYCPVCEIFNTEEEAVEWVKQDFKYMGFSWDERFSMCGGTDDRDVFPIRECEWGEHEWDIHKKRFVIDK